MRNKPSKDRPRSVKASQSGEILANRVILAMLYLIIDITLAIVGEPDTAFKQWRCMQCQIIDFYC